jgi:hypothetical protein
MAKFGLLAVFHGLGDSVFINCRGVFYAVIYSGGFYEKDVYRDRDFVRVLREAAKEMARGGLPV